MSAGPSSTSRWTRFAWRATRSAATWQPTELATSMLGLGTSRRCQQARASAVCTTSATRRTAVRDRALPVGPGRAQWPRSPRAVAPAARSSFRTSRVRAPAPPQEHPHMAGGRGHERRDRHGCAVPSVYYLPFGSAGPGSGSRSRGSPQGLADVALRDEQATTEVDRSCIRVVPSPRRANASRRPTQTFTPNSRSDRSILGSILSTRRAAGPAISACRAGRGRLHRPVRRGDRLVLPARLR